MPRGIYNRNKKGTGKTSMKRTKFPENDGEQESNNVNTKVKVDGYEITFHVDGNEEPILRSVLEKELKVASKRVDVIKKMLAKINDE